MKLQTIDKNTYRRRLNIFIGVTIVLMLLIALSSSSFLIHLIGDPDGSNFALNLAGVILAVAVVSYVIYRIRFQAFMAEILYVWRLKQELNAIYRQSAKLKDAVDNKNKNGLIITYFNFKASIQLYELDNNDLTLNDLKNDLESFEEKIQNLNMDVSANDYHRGLLKFLA